MRNAVILLVCLSAIAYADFADGLRSYRAGDYAQAFAQWLPLAEAGDARAQNSIGSLYHFGRGTRQDYEEAAKWYQRAAEQGLPVAQNNLGYAYLKGHGVTQDYLKSEMWFSLAGPGKDQADADARAELARLLTPDLMAQALRLAQEWHANWAASHASAERPTVVKWIAGGSKTGHFWANGLMVEVVTVEGITICSTLTPQGDKLIARVYVANQRGLPVDVVPPRFTLQSTDPAGPVLASLPVDKVRKKQSWGATLAQMGAGAANGYESASGHQRKSSSATVTSSDGTTSQVDLYTPDDSAQKQQDELRQNVQKQAMERAAYNRVVDGQYLSANTLMPGRDIMGDVFFKIEPKKFNRVTLRIPIEQITAEFEFTSKK